MKYYLRGVGIGLLTATVILSIVFGSRGNTRMSDKEVIARAKELGMIEQDSSSGNAGYKTIDQVIDEAGKNVANQDKTSSDENKDKAGKTEENNSAKEDNNKDNTIEDNSIEDTDNKVVTITVKGGEYSDTVCERLEEEGLVKDAVEFNDYLHEQGLDELIQPGTFKIQMGSTKKEIADILVRKKP